MGGLGTMRATLTGNHRSAVKEAAADRKETTERSETARSETGLRSLTPEQVTRSEEFGKRFDCHGSHPGDLGEDSVKRAAPCV